MKKQETNTAQMDEIIFEKRNKLYGAYIIRKMYNKHLNRALLLAIAILFAGLAYPVVSGYYAHNKLVSTWYEGPVVIFPPPLPPEDMAPPPPPPPPPIAELQKKVIFVAPEVIVGEIIGDIDPWNMDDISATAVNGSVDVQPESTVEKQADVIDIPESQKEIFTITEEMPSYPGGETERMKFMYDNLQFPQLASEMNIQGTVYIQFVVDSKGNITDVKLLRGIGGGCDDEAVRVVKMMPKWHPGKQNGKAVRVLYTMSIGFKFQS